MLHYGCGSISHTCGISISGCTHTNVNCNFGCIIFLFMLICCTSYDEDVNRTWENIKENIETSAEESLGLYELKQNKPWFDEECLGFLDQRKRAKML